MPGLVITAALAMLLFLLWLGSLFYQIDVCWVVGDVYFGIGARDGMVRCQAASATIPGGLRLGAGIRGGMTPFHEMEWTTAEWLERDGFPRASGLGITLRSKVGAVGATFPIAYLVLLVCGIVGVAMSSKRGAAIGSSDQRRYKHRNELP